MAHTRPHFDHHMREVYRTRRRFRIALAVLFAAMFSLAGLQFRGSDASGSVRVSGRVIGPDGLGIANVRLHVCHDDRYVVSNGTGYWSATVPQGGGYCARYVTGARGYSVPKPVNNRPENSSESSYEAQVAGYDCYNDAAGRPSCTAGSRTWDRAHDIGVDFVSAEVDKEAVLPATKVKLAQVVKSQPAVLPAAVAATADKVAPSVPGNFQATVESGNAVVNLTWDASTDAGGLKGYVVERSLDQHTWEKVAESVVGTSYSDKSAGFGIHYFYRLSAVDVSGNASGYATSDATTGDFNSNSGGPDGTTYTSDDGLVTVLVPGNAVPTDAVCSVSSVDVSKLDRKPGTKDKPLVTGPYNLICKNASGDQIRDFLRPVTWTYDLSKIGGVNTPKPYTFSSGGQTTLIESSKFESGLLTFDSTSSDSTVVLGSPSGGVPLNFIIMLLFLAGIIAGVAILILRKKQKSTYDDYLRKKYYNL